MSEFGLFIGKGIYKEACDVLRQRERDIELPLKLGRRVHLA